ncbi:CBS domain-containing protein [Streptomyces albogriseolus]|uniref:CBS domain-containing protein n=1 Tax=Streptomyces albogriseolus TaxID=1887 RepID=UPI002257B70F|nr:CBS domain-containing protein [Streptomyces viridodiastaticus]MCX4564817.1 CBS domain-containing protein [Streptomyces viridodiastaticus]
MTLGQLQDRPVSPRPLTGTVIDVMDAAGPQVWYDMTIEVALSVIAAARVEHLIVCDDDARCVGLVTQTRLTAVRDSSEYTDRLRLGDITDNGGPFISPSATREEAEDAMLFGRLGLVPVVDEHGSALGVLALSR